MADPILPRQLAQSTLDVLKKAGHIVLAPGGSEQVVRDLGLLIEPVLKTILSNVHRSPIMGEVSSTFGTEATDEAVEELVSAMRDALLDSDGVEDVFADDRTIERAIFRAFADSLKVIERTVVEEDEDIPPISVRLDTLGYVAATAARTADRGTLEDALDRAAAAAEAELKTFDEGTRTAFFRPIEQDPERRLDIESAIEEELSDLVDLGVVELPTLRRSVSLPALSDDARRVLRRHLDELTQRHLTIALCPGSWDWDAEKRHVEIVFTPLSDPDETMVERAMKSFLADLAAVLEGIENAPAPPERRPPSQATAPSNGDALRGALDLVRAVEALTAAKPNAAKAPSKTAAAGKSTAGASKSTAGPKKPTTAAAKKPAAKKPTAKKKT